MPLRSLFSSLFSSAFLSSQTSISIPTQGRSTLRKKGFSFGTKSPRRLLSSFALFCLSLGVSVPSYATTYYVDNQGNDKASGTSQSKPWQSIDRVNSQDLNAGDQVLFRGGQTFLGSLYLPKSDSGTRTNPVLISSYGTGASWISSGGQAGLFGYNVTGVTVSNLKFLGSGSTSNTTDGVSFYTDASSGAEGVTLSSLDVSGYGGDGIVFGSWNTYYGYHHVKITSSISHYNADGGVQFYAQYTGSHADVYLWQVTASYNSGKAGGTKPSGSGITLGGVSGGTVEYSQAYENGWLCDSSQGPVGIWAHDSTNIWLQYNTSHHNHTAKGDGDGFDLDQNVSYSTMQYNTSYQNDGAGYLLAHAPANANHTGNTVQYNTSTDDSRKLAYGAIQAWGRIRNTTIRGNTVSLSPGVKSYIANITLANWSIPSNCLENVTISGNNFTATSGPNFVIATSAILQCSTGLSFKANTYLGSPISLWWGPTQYTNLVTWTTATGQN